MNPIRTLEKIKSIFKKGSKAIIAVEIGQGWVKAAASKETNGLRKIVNVTAKKLTGTRNTEIARVVKEVLAEMGPGQFKLAASLPRHSVTMRYISLPSTDPAELENIAALQAIKQLPYPKDEIIIGHKILEKNVGGYSKVMLVVVHKNAINKYLDIFKINGIEPEIITVSTEAINHYFVRAAKPPSTDTSKAVLLIDIDASFTEMQVCRNQKVVFSRSLHHGLDDYNDEAKKAAWMDEMKLTLSTYAREKDSSLISNAVLTGAAWKKEGIDGFLSTGLNIPVGAIYPLSGLLVEPEAESKFGKAGYTVSFSSVIALAMDYQRMDINLLPRPVKASHERKVQYRSLANVGILMLCFALILSIFTLKKLHDKRVYLNLLKNKLEAIAPEADALNKKAKIAKMVREHLKAEGSCLDIMRETYAVIPSNIFLTRYIYEEGKGITLKGSSPSMSQVVKLVPILEKSKYFKEVQLRYASKRKKKGVDLTDFEIFISLR